MNTPENRLSPPRRGAVGGSFASVHAIPHGSSYTLDGMSVLVEQSEITYHYVFKIENSVGLTTHPNLRSVESTALQRPLILAMLFTLMLYNNTRQIFNHTLFILYSLALTCLQLPSGGVVKRRWKYTPILLGIIRLRV